MANNREENSLEEQQRKYWNPGSYRYYIRYPRPAIKAKSVILSASNKQVKRLYWISTAFKLAKIVAIILVALILLGHL
jgi:hypothetical protein